MPSVPITVDYVSWEVSLRDSAEREGVAHLIFDDRALSNSHDKSTTSVVPRTTPKKEVEQNKDVPEQDSDLEAEWVFADSEGRTTTAPVSKSTSGAQQRGTTDGKNGNASLLGLFSGPATMKLEQISPADTAKALIVKSVSGMYLELIRDKSPREAFLCLKAYHKQALGRARIEAYEALTKLSPINLKDDANFFAHIRGHAIVTQRLVDTLRSSPFPDLTLAKIGLNAEMRALRPDKAVRPDEEIYLGTDPIWTPRNEETVQETYRALGTTIDTRKNSKVPKGVKTETSKLSGAKR